MTGNEEGACQAYLINTEALRQIEIQWEGVLAVAGQAVGQASQIPGLQICRPIASPVCALVPAYVSVKTGRALACRGVQHCTGLLHQACAKVPAGPSPSAGQRSCQAGRRTCPHSGGGEAGCRHRL